MALLVKEDGSFGGCSCVHEYGPEVEANEDGSLVLRCRGCNTALLRISPDALDALNQKEKVARPAVTKNFLVVPLGYDEYPGDGLRLRMIHGGQRSQLSKDFLTEMGVAVSDGDEVEIAARVVSRIETRRVPT